MRLGSHIPLLFLCDLSFLQNFSTEEKGMIFRHTSTKWLTRKSEHQVLLRLILHQPENRQQLTLQANTRKTNNLADSHLSHTSVTQAN